jgi:hypothetical protein
MTADHKAVHFSSDLQNLLQYDQNESYVPRVLSKLHSVTLQILSLHKKFCPYFFLSPSSLNKLHELNKVKSNTEQNTSASSCLY